MIVLSYLINNIRRIVMKSSLENEIEAATLKRLLSHIDERKDVQISKKKNRKINIYLIEK